MRGAQRIEVGGELSEHRVRRERSSFAAAARASAAAIVPAAPPRGRALQLSQLVGERASSSVCARLGQLGLEVGGELAREQSEAAACT